MCEISKFIENVLLKLAKLIKKMYENMYEYTYMSKSRCSRRIIIK